MDVPGPGGPDQRRRGARLLLIGLAVGGVGILITAITYSVADPGDSYRVAIGPMLLGAVLVVVGLVQMGRAGGAAAPGWRPDPTGRHQQRWWDGSRWTDRVSDGGVEATDPIGGSGRTAAPPPDATPGSQP